MRKKKNLLISLRKPTSVYKLFFLFSFVKFLIKFKLKGFVTLLFNQTRTLRKEREKKFQVILKR